MRIQFDIQPRQTGKTTSLAKMALANKKGIFITINSEMERYITEQYNINPNNITVQPYYDFVGLILDNEYNIVPEYINNLYFSNHKYANIYIDEYLFYEYYDQDKLNYILSTYFNTANVFVKTTADKLLNRDLYNLVRLMRKNKINHSNLPNEIYNKTKYLYNNLLTHPDCKVSINNHFMRTDLSYRTEVLGELFE